MAARMKKTLFLVSLLTIGIVFGDNQENEIACGNNLADVVFVLDGSGSIYGPDFTKQLDFVESTIETFDVGFNRTHVGVLTFSTDYRIIFHLGKYHTDAELKNEVKDIEQMKGQTNTHLALKSLREEMLSKEHARRWVPHVAIVITDGDSDYQQKTKDEARLCHDENIQVYAIGVGSKVSHAELEAIASAPDMIHTVDDYMALKALRLVLASKACQTPTTPPPPTTTTPPKMVEGCSGHKVMDHIWSISDQADVVETDLTIDFIKSLTLDMTIDPKNVQVGLAPRFCDDGTEIRLKDHDTREGFLEELETRRLSGLRTERTIQYIRRQGHSSSNGGRSEAVKFATLIVDNRLENWEQALEEAKRAKDENIRLLVIGVGDRVQQDQLRQLCSFEKDYLYVRNYSELADLKSKLIQTICEGITGKKVAVRDYVEWYFD